MNSGSEGVNGAEEGERRASAAAETAETAEGGDPEIVTTAARSASKVSVSTSLPSSSSFSSTPPASLSVSPLSSPSSASATAAAASPPKRRAGGGSNGYVSAQQKKQMDLSSYGSPTSASSSAASAAAAQPSSSSSFLSSFAKKLGTVNPSATSPGKPSASLSPTAAAASSSHAPLAASPSPPVSPSQAAAVVTSTAGSSSAAAPSSSSSSSAGGSASPPVPAPVAAGASGSGSGKFHFGTSLTSMLRSLSTSSVSSAVAGASSASAAQQSGNGASAASAITSASTLTASEALNESQRQQWLAILSSSAPYAKVRSRCVKLAWFGIPSSVRGECWSFIIGNALNITEDLFWIMSGRAQEVKELKKTRLEREERERDSNRQKQNGAAKDSNGSSSGAGADSQPTVNREESVSLIDTDVSRTFPDLKFFHDGGPLQAPLFQVLESYGCYRPDVGYVQGMSFLSGILLLNMEPLPAFVALCNLLNQDMYFKFYRMNAQQMKIHLDVFQTVFKDQLPQLFAHFSSIGVQADMYLYDWLLTIFSRALPLDVTHRVWDNFLCNGHVFLFRTALGLLRLQQQTFIALGFEEALQLLNRPPKDVDADALFAEIAKISVTEDKLSRLIAARESKG